jgi:hypothetical protein
LKTVEEEIPLSVVVTVFHPSRGLANLTNWLNNKSSSRLEIILVHDTSDKETLSLNLERNSPSDEFVFVEGNYGSPGASRNAGLEKATREWITFWDFDDLPNLEAVMEFMGKLLQGDYQVGIGSFQIVSKNSGKTLSQKIFPSEIVSESLNLSLVNPGIWRWIIRRTVIGETRFRKYQIGEDQFFLAEIGAYNCKVAITQSVTYSYFIGDPSQQTAKLENFNNINALIADVISLRLQATGINQSYIGIVILILIRKSLKINRSFANFNYIFWLILSSKMNLIKVLVSVWKMRRILQASVLQYPSKTETKRIDFFGGLGNQLFQLVLALTLNRVYPVTLINPSQSIIELVSRIEKMPIYKARSHHRIELAQSKTIREDKIRNLFIRVSGFGNSSLGMAPKSLKSIFEFCLGTIMYTSSRWLCARDLGYDKSLIPRLIGRQSRVVGYMQTYVWAESLRDIFLKSIQEFVHLNPELRKLSLLAEIEKPIFVQCRIGDYRNNAKIGLVSDLFFSQAIAHLSKSYDNRKVWLFSDEPDNALSRLSHVLGQNVTVIRNNFSDLEMLGLLTFGDMFIISNSTFGWWGAFLSGSKVVIAPKPWFRKIVEPNKLVPQNWIRINQN